MLMSRQGTARVLIGGGIWGWEEARAETWVVCTVSWAWDVGFACSLAPNLRLVAGAGVWFAVTGFQNSMRD